MDSKPTGLELQVLILFDRFDIKIDDHDAPNLEGLVKSTDYIDNKHVENVNPILFIVMHEVEGLTVLTLMIMYSRYIHKLVL